MYKLTFYTETSKSDAIIITDVVDSLYCENIEHEENNKVIFMFNGNTSAVLCQLFLLRMQAECGELYPFIGYNSIEDKKVSTYLNTKRPGVIDVEILNVAYPL